MELAIYSFTTLYIFYQDVKSSSILSSIVAYLLTWNISCKHLHLQCCFVSLLNSFSVQGPFRGSFIERLSIILAEPNKQETVAGDTNSLIHLSLIESNSFGNIASEEEGKR